MSVALPRQSFALVAWIVAGCGNGTVSPDASSDAARDSGVVRDCDAGYTQCTGPCGAKLCGGPAMCNVGCPDGKCGDDLVFLNADPTRLRICLDGRDGNDWSLGCQQCPDGFLCVFEDQQWVTVDKFRQLGMSCWAPEFGVLLSMNGHADWVRYSDRSTYTGDPLPEPTTCPQIAGLPLCGGTCGACADGYVCVGRSPLHPYSICVPKWNQPNQSDHCTRGNYCSATKPRKCLTFKVDAAAQPVADEYSLCVDAAACDAAAQSYPGGAFCGP